MAAMSDFLENKLIDWLFRAQVLEVTITELLGVAP